MKKSLLVCLLVLISANAEIIKNKKFNLVCKEEGSIGLLLKNNKWIEGPFELNKYLVRKYEDSKCDAKEKTKDLVPFFTDPSSSMNISYGCYKVIRMDNDFHNTTMETCSESWIKKGKLFKLNLITCNQIGIEPNGRFLRSSLYLSKNNITANPKEGKKATHTISHEYKSITVARYKVP